MPTIKHNRENPYSDYLKKVATVESGNNPNARAKTSSASGLYQFTESTWKNLNDKYNLGYKLEDRFDPNKSKKMAEILTSENEAVLKTVLGDNITDGDRYLSHFLGAQGAKNLLSSSPDSKVSSVVSQGALKANKSIFYNKDGSEKTVNDIRNWANKKMNIKPTEENITTDVNNFEIQQINSNFASVPYIEQPKEEKIDKDIEEVETKTKEQNFLDEISKTGNREIAQQEVQQYNQPQIQLPNNDFVSEFGQISQFIDTPLAQQGGEYSEAELAFLREISPTSKNGLYDYPNQPVNVSTSNGAITMKNINYDVLGIDEFGNRQLMKPNGEYQFKGKNILEIPLNKKMYSQQGGINIKINRGNGDEIINTSSNEYRQLYEQGLIGAQTNDADFYNQLNEVTVTGRPKTKNESVINAEYLKINNEAFLNQEDKPYKKDIIKDIKNDSNAFSPVEMLLYVSDKEKKEIDLDRVIEDKRLQIENKKTDLNPTENTPDEIKTSDLSSKEAIIKIQNRLTQLGYNLNPKGTFKNKGVDGILGNVTKKAIEDYNSKKEKGVYTSYKNKEGFLGNCKEEQCSEFTQNELFRNFKPNVSRDEWNNLTGLYGDAWTIGNNIEKSGGEKVEKVKEGDIVTMYTGGFSSYLPQAKKFGTDATHVGVVDKVNPDGSYYILHNVHEGSKDNYQGKEYRSLVKNNSTQDMGFSIREKYRPAYENVKNYESKNKVREDVKIIIPGNNISKLEELKNKEIIGGDIKENVDVFLSSLNNIDNKKAISSKYGLTEDEYQSLSKLSLGIIAQESKFGVSDKYKVKEPVAKIAKAFGLKTDEVSKGAGQIKYETNYGNADLTELGINKSNFKEDKNTVLVVLDRLASNYKNLKKENTTEKALYKAVEKYNRGHNTKYSDEFESDYANKVVLFSDMFEIEDKNSNIYKTPIDNIILNKKIMKRVLN